MVRFVQLRRFFWEQVADGLQLADWRHDQSRFPQDVLVGSLGGVTVETGAFWSGGGMDQRRVERTFASVTVEGLPAGLEIDAGPSLVPHPQEKVSCSGSRTRTVTVKPVTVQMGGLWLEEVSVTLDRYLTPNRREAICSVDSGLHWAEGGHQARIETDGLPYPPKQILRSAESGDAHGRQELLESRDRVVALVQKVVRDSEVIARELRFEQADDPTR